MRKLRYITYALILLLGVGCSTGVELPVAQTGCGRIALNVESGALAASRAVASES